jgi:inner membrane protein
VDPITHMTAGALAGQVARQRFSGKVWLFFCILCAVLPDIDNLSSFISPESFLIHHRGITHSFIGGLVLACFMAALFKLFYKKFSIIWGFAVAYGCILTHIFLDLITSYGTQIFAPLTNERYSVPCVFILDPVFTLSLIGFFYASFKWKDRRMHFAVAGLIWMVAFPTINFGLGAAVQHSISARMAQTQVHYTRLYVTPDFLAPFFWKIIVEDPDTYRITGINLLKPEKSPALQTFRKADMNLMKHLGCYASIFGTYAWFSAYPIMERQDTVNGSKITFGDLRFYNTFLKHNPGTNRGRLPFSLTAFLDKKGELTAYVYGHQIHTRTIQHLE